ncbi:MAG: hypothetical protein ABFC96_09450 [Thermoguttaceae bacterium]
MSNPWAFTLVLENSSVITEKVVATTFEVVNEAGFFLPTPISGISVDGKDPLAFDDAAMALAAMCSEGGLLTFWKNAGAVCPSDICVTFDPRSKEIRVGVTYSLEKERNGDAQVAADLHTIFVCLCRRLAPLHGYATDDWGWELCFPGDDCMRDWEAFRAAVRRKEPPPVLFWTNYFDTEYFSRVDQRVFSDICHRQERLEHGVLVYLADDIWKATFGFLEPSGRYSGGIRPRQ